MQKSLSARFSNFVFLISCFLIIYMPLHVFIVQLASLVTGGISIWKAAKDVAVFALVPLLLFISYKKKVYAGKYFWHLVVGSAFVLLHLLFVVFDSKDDTYSTVVGTVYNSRLLVYLLLGVVVGSYKLSEKYLKYLLTATVIIASLVAIFGILQYFLPHDMLANVGYSLERGVKPMFFIDDKPDLPRVMSTLKDPNSLGAYLILPIILSGFAFYRSEINQKLFIKPFRRRTLMVMMDAMLLALFLTFSRGALLALFLSTATILYIVVGKRAWGFIKKHWVYFVASLFIIPYLLFMFRNTYVFQNLVFHSDKSTVLADPNELRVSLTQQAVDEIADTPLGHGPGSAGLVSIKNPQGGVLTENYYLQIAYEVGWAGIALFVVILYLLASQLYALRNKNPLAAVLLSSLVGYLFYSLLIHLWSNEAVALQWWLLTGVVLGLSIKSKSSAT